MDIVSPSEMFEEHFYTLLKRLGNAKTRSMLKEAGVDITDKKLTALTAHSSERFSYWRGRRPLGKKKVVALRHALMKTIETHEGAGTADYLDVEAQPPNQLNKGNMEDIYELLTSEQLATVHEMIEHYPQGARDRILQGVLGQMDPPKGVDREFDTRGRVRMYHGYLAPSLAAKLVQEFS